VFIDKKDAIVPWLGPDWVTFSDDLIAPIRKHILDLYKFDPGKECVIDVLEEFAIDGAYDPVVNYLGGLRWDGVERLQTWLINYLGAEDNALNRCFGTVTLVAAVRRALHPGAKFDHMLILEGEQGTGKSTVVEILGLKEYYRNQTINFQDPKSIIEALSGAWFYEWAELAGMRRIEVEKLKSMLSTAVDSARMAYGRMVKIRPRRTIIIGTTNAVRGEYLSDSTGGRRYWSVVTKKILLNDLSYMLKQWLPS
jgi:predicted P-loop ATPase